MNHFILLISIFLFLPLSSYGIVDIRLGGGLGFEVGDNGNAIPQKDGGSLSKFTSSGFSADILLSDFWLVLGARTEKFDLKIDHFFYFDDTANQYTKYSIRTENRAHSGIVGFHFELNREEDSPSGQTVFYSAGIFGVIPFDKSNSVEVESRNALSDTKVSGVGNDLKQWSVYLEANRSVSKGFTTGFQFGYRFYKVDDIQDSSGNPLLDYQGNPLTLDLSHIDFRIFMGIRF